MSGDLQRNRFQSRRLPRYGHARIHRETRTGRALLIGALFTTLIHACAARPVVGRRAVDNDVRPPRCTPPDIANCSAPAPPILEELTNRAVASTQACAVARDCRSLETASFECGEEGTIRVLADTRLTNQAFTCDIVTFELAAGVTLMLERPRFVRAELHIQGAPLSRVRLLEPNAEELGITLGGATSLEVVNGVFADVDLQATRGLRRNVFVDETSLRTANIELSPEVSLHLRRSQLNNAHVTAPSMLTEHSVASASYIIADDLVDAASEWSTVYFEVGYAAFYDTHILGSQILRCGLLDVRGEVIASFLGPCDTPIAFDGKLIRTTVLGSAELRGELQGSRFVPGAGETLTMDRVKMDGGLFCDTEVLNVSDARIRCVACDPDIEQVTVSHVDVVGSDCPALELAAERDTGETSIPPFEDDGDS